MTNTIRISSDSAPKETRSQDTQPDENPEEKQGSVRALSSLNFFLADVQNGMGPYVTVFLNSSVHWNPAQIGAALAAGNIAQVIAQTPTGGLIDQLRQKRQLIVIGSLMILTACLAIAFKTVFPVVLTAQILIGIAGAIFPPCIAAITLGIVGREKMDRQTGKNQAFNAAGNLTAALLIGLVGYFIGLRWMFGLIVILCAGAIFCVLRVRDEDIDYNLARGADKAEVQGEDCEEEPNGIKETLSNQFCGLKELVKNRLILVFLVSAVIFHFANAAMVPLVTVMLSQGQGGKVAILYTSGYMMASQLIFMAVAAMAGRFAGSIGRKPLFLFGFAALALRGVLYTLNHNPGYLIAVQCMDGLGAGIFGVVSVLIISDLTKGTGRFNLAQGAIATAVGTGAFLSNSVGGIVAKHAGPNVAFLILAGIATAGLIFFWIMMPETGDKAKNSDPREKSQTKPVKERTA